MSHTDLGETTSQQVAYLPLKGGGVETRIGQNGKPIDGSLPLTAKQLAVVDAHKKQVQKGCGSNSALSEIRTVIGVSRMQSQQVWVFNGSGGRFPGAVFDGKDRALMWIKGHTLSGVLTCYPVDVGVYDWAIANGLFKPSKLQHAAPEFIGSFTTAGQEHYHFEGGEQV